MMRHSIGIALVSSVLVLATAVTAFAKPGLNGPTGLTFVPTSFTIKPKTIDVALSGYQLDRPGSDIDVLPLRVVAGVVHRLEAGIMFMVGDRPYDVEAAITAKWKIPGFLPRIGNWAIGFIAPTKDEAYKGWYAVAEKNLFRRIFLHYGVGGNFEGRANGWAPFNGRRAGNVADPLVVLGALELRLNRVQAWFEVNDTQESFGATYTPKAGKRKKAGKVSYSLYYIHRGEFEESLQADSHSAAWDVTVRF